MGNIDMRITFSKLAATLIAYACLGIGHISPSLANPCVPITSWHTTPAPTPQYDGDKCYVDTPVGTAPEIVIKFNGFFSR